jgi:hypothetical protein
MDEGVEQREGDEPSAVVAEFHTAELVVVGEVSGLEGRFSDFLNISDTSIEVKPKSIQLRRTGERVDLDTRHAVLDKEQLLLVTGTMDPQHHADPFTWRETQGCQCWLSLGLFVVTATIHLHPDLDPRTALSRLDSHFISLTGAAVRSPESTREYGLVFVNRRHVSMLTLLK